MNKWTLLRLMLPALIFVQCSDDDNAPDTPKDTEKPVIAVTSPSAGAALYGTVQVKATATDNDGISTVEIFVDNNTTPIQKITTGTVDFAWDTKTFDDGEHTLKFVATDAAKNTAEAQVTVTIRNTLLTFSLPANYIPDDYYYWIFISDDKGKVLDTKGLQDNSTYKFEAPDNFTGQNVTMSILRYQYNPTYEEFAYIYSYPNLPFGDYGYTGSYTPIPGSIGQSNITISDAPNIDFFTQHRLTYPAGVAFSQAAFHNGEGLQIQLSTAYDKSAFMFSQGTNGLLNYLYKEITPGSNDVYTTGDFVDADTKAITVPSATSYTLSVTGSNQYGDFYFYPVQAAASKGGVITAPSPDIFTSYATTVRMNNADVSYGYYLRGSGIPAEAKALNGSLSFTADGSSIASDASGVYDLAIFSATSATPQLFINWVVYVPGGKQNFVVPALPQILIDNYNLKNFSDLSTPYGYLYDYAEASGYTDFIAKHLKPATAVVTTEYSYLIKLPASQGGRLKELDPKEEERMRKAH